MGLPEHHGRMHVCRSGGQGGGEEYDNMDMKRGDGLEVGWERSHKGWYLLAPKLADGCP